jgi:hypothetical protein
MGLPDLVTAKKTQRDKDWPMVRRLMEAHYFEHRAKPSLPRIRFWLRELRTPELLVEVARRWPAERSRLARRRRLLRLVDQGEKARAAALRDEEDAERARDAAYWAPLRAELERLRHARMRGASAAPRRRGISRP